MTKREKNEKKFGIRISNRTLKRLQKHISSINLSQNQDLSQQDWISKAIEEKLHRHVAEPSTTTLRTKQLTVRLDQKLRNQLDETLERLKSSKGEVNYSKKSWILEAIEEKLEKDDRE